MTDKTALEERVARIIDPDAWLETWDDGLRPAAGSWIDQRRIKSLAKAREILALAPPVVVGEDDGVSQLVPSTGGYLIIKRGLYYRPNSCGYTGLKDQAGRYTREEAEAHADPISGVTFVAEEDAPDIASACFDDIAIKHLQSKITALSAELAGVREANVTANGYADNWCRRWREDARAHNEYRLAAQASIEVARAEIASLKERVARWEPPTTSSSGSAIYQDPSRASEAVAKIGGLDKPTKPTQ